MTKLLQEIKFMLQSLIYFWKLGANFIKQIKSIMYCMQYPVYNWGQTCTKLYTLFRTNFCETVYPVWDRGQKPSLHRPSRSPNNICRNSESLSLEGCKMVPQESCVWKNFGPFSNLGSSFYGSLSLIFGWFDMLKPDQMLICKSQSIWKPGSRSLAKSRIYYSIPLPNVNLGCRRPR